MPSTSVKIENVTKAFGDVIAVDAVNVEVAQGEFFTLLGSSGCGKTTLLRMIAGFLRQTAGHIRFGERLIDDVPPHRRQTGMVFQSYAIFPHLTVVDNIAYGLRARGLPRAEIQEKVARMLALTRLDGLGHRKPRELSGGQQQRVVLSRAIVIEPDVLLMDEPLSNLDTEMRLHLRTEIRALQRQIGVTTIYVTHDQEEALLLSDRIAVMRHGRIEQIGSPTDIYNRPATRFVAGFIGESNFLPARRLADADGLAVFALPGDGRVLGRIGPSTVPPGACDVVFRPQDVELAEPDGRDGELVGTIIDVHFMGGTLRNVVEIAPGVTLQAAATGRTGMALPQPGWRCAVRVPSAAVWSFATAER